MSEKPTLRLDWCSHAAAKYAVEHWHYSHSLPTNPLVKIGVWEENHFIGCVLFSRGANCNALKPFGLAITEGAELSRVALSTHYAKVSKIVRIAIRFITQSNPGLRLLFSYADPNHGHHGGIYQALNWIYIGKTAADFQARDAMGRLWHSRQVSRTGVKRQYGAFRCVPRHDQCTMIPLLGKHKYLYPLDADIRAQIAPLAKPYPKRATSILADAPADQAGESGAAPTVALCPIMG